MKKINIQGKPYIPVNERLMEFWKNNPAWSIRTELVEAPQGKVRFKACIYDENGNLRATGHGEEKENSTFINKSSHVENCETSAVGRALGVLGIGIDTSLASMRIIEKWTTPVWNWNITLQKLVIIFGDRIKLDINT
jgi:hypothetical protein